MSANSAHEYVVDEIDLALIGALQINPRASWAVVARVLDVDPATVSRRWARLAADGAAWVSCQPLFTGSPALAFVEITVANGRILDVAADLGRDAEAMTIDVSAGARDLLVTVVCDGPRDLSRYLLERIPRVRNIQAVRSHIITRAYADASGWRLRTLDPLQVDQITQTRPSRPDQIRATGSMATVLRLVSALSEDGRASAEQLASAIGSSESTARRRLEANIRAGRIRLRCELARDLTGFPVSEWIFLRVPPDRLDGTAAAISAVPEVRAILSAAGPFNLIVSVWLRSLEDGQRLETQITRKLPHVEVVDRSVVIRPFKLAGRLMDTRGFATDVVPIR